MRMRFYRLTNEPGGLGLSCTPAGLTLAGVPLLRKTEKGFVPRSAAEIVSLIEGAYGADGDLTRLKSSLGPIAQSLNNGDFARAAMVAVLTRTPELSDVAAERLATAYEELTKYNPDEPRDWHGRWTKTDAAGSVSISAPADLDAARRAADLLSPHVSEHESGDAEEYASNTPVAAPEAGHADDEDSESHEPTSLEQTFERKYDDLGRSNSPSRLFSLAID